MSYRKRFYILEAHTEREREREREGEKEDKSERDSRKKDELLWPEPKECLAQLIVRKAQRFISYFTARDSINRSRNLRHPDSCMYVCGTSICNL